MHQIWHCVCYVTIMTVRSKSYCLSTILGFPCLSIVLFTKVAGFYVCLPFLMVIVSHDLTRPEQRSQWWLKTESDAFLWLPFKHGFIHARGELARTGRTPKLSRLSSVAWLETRRCMIWLNSAICTYFSDRRVCFKYGSSRILDFLFTTFSFSVPYFLKQSRICSLLYHMHHL